jgi:hypothetical protein
VRSCRASASRSASVKDVPCPPYDQSLNVDVEYGVVVAPRRSARRGDALAVQRMAVEVPGVRGVQNLTHLPGEPAPDDPRLPLHQPGI